METANRIATLPLTSARKSSSRKRPRHGKGRSQVNKSNKFIELPMDIVFEISVELHPLDLLRLSRVSKLFRSIYMSRQTQNIWRAALKRIVPEPPPCAPDLNESQYTSLLFESSCWACGNRHAKNLYGLRLKLCTSCWGKNVVSGRSIRNMSNDLPLVVYSLVPRHVNHDKGLFLSIPSTCACESYSTSYNQSSHYYYKAELEMVVDRYYSLQQDKTALKAFIQERQQISLDMIQHGCKMYLWETLFKRHQAELANERQASIELKLNQSGWPTTSFPSENDGADLEKWLKLTNQPEPLTAESWLAIFPKLKDILLRVDDKACFDALNGRIRSHYWLFCQQLSPLDMATMPHWPDARVLPSIANTLSRFREDIDETSAFWDSVFSNIVNEARPYSTSVKKTLIRLLKRASPRPFPSSGNPDDVLMLPASVFECTSERCCLRRSDPPSARFFTYPEILTHSFYLIFHTRWSIDSVDCDPGVTKIVFLMLKALNLPVDASQETILKLDGKLRCLCSHPRYSKEHMSFFQLVKHVADENHAFNNLCAIAQAVHPESVTEVFNDHDMEGADPVIAVVASDSRAPSPIRAISRRGYLDKFYRLYGGRAICYCAACYRLSYQLIDFNDEEELLYHLKAKHHINVLRKADIDTRVNLVRRYGERRK